MLASPLTSVQTPLRWFGIEKEQLNNINCRSSLQGFIFCVWLVFKGLSFIYFISFVHNFLLNT